MLRLLPGALLLLAAGAVEAHPNRGPFKKIAIIRLREDPGEHIDDSVKTSVLRRIELAREWGADCVILDIESYGGLVPSSIETADELYALGREVHTIAYVGRKAISGAAMLSIACQEIVMHEVGKIGDSQAISPGPDGRMVQAPEKIQSTVAATFRTYAEGNGYPVPVVEAMVRQEMEVIRYRKRNPPPDWVYFRSDTAGDLPTPREIEVQGLEEPPETVVREGELAIFSARQAVDYGLCSRIEPTLDALLKSISDGETKVSSLEWSWSERVSRFVLGYRWLLFLLGIGSLYFALKMPGTGVPEALAVISFGLFFGASAIAGFAGPIEMVLFLVGVALLVVEIFVLPGFGVAGFLGLVAIFVAIGLAAIPEVQGDAVKPASKLLVEMALHFLGGAFGAIFAAFLLARYLPHVPFFHRLALAPAAAQTGSAVAPPSGSPHPMVGATGVAETQLRPAGRARIGTEHVDVVAEAGFVPAGTKVKVVAVRGSLVTVRAER
jgi:membrane-bound serine protease (ClpP class)